MNKQPQLTLENVSPSVMSKALTRFMRRHTTLQKSVTGKNFDTALYYLALADSEISLVLPDKILVYSDGWLSNLNGVLKETLWKHRDEMGLTGLKNSLNRAQSTISSLMVPNRVVQSTAIVLDYLRLLGIPWRLEVTKPTFNNRGDTQSKIAFKACNAIDELVSNANSLTDYIRKCSGLGKSTSERIRRCRQSIIDKPMTVGNVLGLCIDLGLVIKVEVYGTVIGVYTNLRLLSDDLLNCLNAYQPKRGVESLVLPCNNYLTELNRETRLPIARLHRYFSVLNIDLTFEFLIP